MKIWSSVTEPVKGLRQHIRMVVGTNGSQVEDVVTKLWFTHVREKNYSMVLLDNDGVRFALLIVLNGYVCLKSIRYILRIFFPFLVPHPAHITSPKDEIVGCSEYHNEKM